LQYSGGETGKTKAQGQPWPKNVQSSHLSKWLGTGHVVSILATLGNTDRRTIVHWGAEEEKPVRT
jgi:hypothetical protein